MKKGVWIGLGIAALLVGPAIYGELSRKRLYGEVLKERELARKAGMPITAADLQPNPPVSDEQNAAIPLKEAHRLLMPVGAKRGNPIVEAKKFFSGGSDRFWGAVEDDPVAMARHLQAMSPVLALVDEAVKRPKLDFKRNWEDGPMVVFPELSSMRLLIRALCLRAYTNAGRGSAGAAVEDLCKAGTLCQLIRQEPTIIAGLVGAASESIVLETARQIEANSVSGAFGTKQVSQVVHALGPPIDVRKALGGEIFMSSGGLDFFSRPDAAEKLSNYGMSKRPIFNANLRLETEVKVLKGYRTLLASWPKNPYDYLSIRETARGPEGEIQKAQADFSSLYDGNITASSYEPGDGIVVSYALGAAASLAKRRLTLAYGRCLEVFRATRAFPKTLPLSGPEAIDPLSRKPLRYVLQPGGFRIYSVGQNLKDDGGKAPRGNDLQDTDIVVSYPIGR